MEIGRDVEMEVGQSMINLLANEDLSLVEASMLEFTSQNDTVLPSSSMANPYVTQSPQSSVQSSLHSAANSYIRQSIVDERSQSSNVIHHHPHHHLPISASHANNTNGNDQQQMHNNHRIQHQMQHLQQPINSSNIQQHFANCQLSSHDFFSIDRTQPLCRQPNCVPMGFPSRYNSASNNDPHEPSPHSCQMKSEVITSDNFPPTLKTEPQDEYLESDRGTSDPLSPFLYPRQPSVAQLASTGISCLAAAASAASVGTYPATAAFPYFLDFMPQFGAQQRPAQQQSLQPQSLQPQSLQLQSLQPQSLQPQSLQPQSLQVPQCSPGSNLLNNLANFACAQMESGRYVAPLNGSTEWGGQGGRQSTSQLFQQVQFPSVGRQSSQKSKVKVFRRKPATVIAEVNDDSLGFSSQKSMETASNDDSEDEHLYIDTGLQPDGFECGECGLVCRTRGGLRKHLSSEHLSDEPEPIDTKRYECSMPMCPFTTVRRDAFDLHMATHIAEGWTPTGKKRMNKAPLQRHRFNKEELVCPLCDYSCTVEKSFRRHLKGHETGQSDIPGKVSCCICGKDRPSESDLKKHMRKHRLEKYYRCDICKFRTVQLKKLIQHRRMHTGEKPHLCPFCPYRAARRDNLRSHVRRMHKRENMYGDTFTPRSLLQAQAECHDAAHSPKENLPLNSCGRVNLVENISLSPSRASQEIATVGLISANSSASMLLPAVLAQQLQQLSSNGCLGQ